MTQENLILPCFPPATSQHHVESSLDMHWALQITLLSPHGLEIQSKQCREGSVWPHRQDEQEIHCTDTTAPHTLLQHSCLLHLSHILLQYLPSQPDQWEFGVILSCTVLFWHIREQSPCLSSWDRFVRVTGSVRHFTEQSAFECAYSSEKNILYITKVCLETAQIYVPCFCTNWSPATTWDN